ncbi:uncharacterized protein LOC107462790 isoform X2 [Arachis duranensis]|uniref:Uncharacterized protein LOC107462790 isoform X2 n=1 Tax=Arachis duranensis TaxID=130453 RepID=A0A6P4BBK2_ARADU|nr:uncharacterized protein LOC107462790 isoform X2 [Arachis duranensis]
MFTQDRREHLLLLHRGAIHGAATESDLLVLHPRSRPLYSALKRRRQRPRPPHSSSDAVVSVAVAAPSPLSVLDPRTSLLHRDDAASGPITIAQSSAIHCWYNSLDTDNRNHARFCILII